MTNINASIQLSERHEEYLALINMLEYTVGIAESLSSKSAAFQLDAARKTLMGELKSELTADLSTHEITQLAGVRAGHC
ncbi:MULTISPECIES: hypothetical protein [unclassified Agrobacterium]|jgi:hypothetical protein|uniref:hypothetical protein n=1 Tax=unclassified Agrobacterium TaxID=2632611 RepID=UPI00177CC6FB|nr:MULTISPECIES: hypothetical protein [unclassified Agrobacterium]MBD9389735.1 hypothetical protein [Agrobacterium sp. AGB01]MDO5898700.1 hypothetical protein [Agrobacterium sp. Azo12]